MSFPTESLATLMANAPVASAPGPSDVFLLLQGGLLKRLPANSLPQLETVPTEIVTTGSYDATIEDGAILVNRSPAASTVINMPDAPGAGRNILVADMAGNCDGGHTITISNATINGIAGKVLNSNYAYCTLFSTGDGNNWIIVT